MEQQKDTMAMLDLLIRPAFCVQNGVIVRLNKAAESLLLESGSQVSSIIANSLDEYREFTNGCLYLTLQIAGTQMNASVTRMDDFDVFQTEEDADQAELKAMALAAQNLREPLNSIMALAGNLFPALEDMDDPVLADQAAGISRGLFQMMRILSNMSDADRYRNNTLFRQETQDVFIFFKELFERIGTMVSHTGIELRFTNLPQSVYCLIDAEKLERAIYNMISNAIKFTPKGGHIDASLVRRGSKLYFTVQDSGTGIPENLLSSVYSRFLRQPGLEEGRQGIGLGMILIRAAAAAHNGTVLIEQPAGQGMRITMTMEIRQNRNASVHSPILPILNVDYAGEWDHGLLELSECLPAEVFKETPKQ